MKTLRRLGGRRLIMANGVVEWPQIAIDSDGWIECIEAGGPSADETVLSSTFFDIHIHGAAGHDVMEGSAEAFARVGGFLATKGVANYLATTVTAPVDATLRALDGIAGAIEAANEYAGARPVGVHLEGPFISHAKRGVHPPADIQPPSIALFERMQEAAQGHIRLMTIAPETAGALELIEYATKTGIKVSLGHSDATAARTRAAIAAGAASATHTFNAMRRLDHREPGIAGVVLDADDIYAELICDGIHVAPELARMWLRAKTEERAILVTDGISATGMPEGKYVLGEFEVTVADGRCLLASDLARGVETLAGSVLTMDRAVANLQEFTRASLATAVRLASRNPARMLGMDGLGEIAVGGPANFNVFSADGTLQSTILRGRVAGSAHDLAS
jgi:N-acetylglucosamine-6-phosphate deacetylase